MILLNTKYYFVNLAKLTGACLIEAIALFFLGYGSVIAIGTENSFLQTLGLLMGLLLFSIILNTLAILIVVMGKIINNAPK